MTAIPKNDCEDRQESSRNFEEHHGSECLSRKVAMTKVAEFYILKTFDRPMKWFGS
jgi:hypothetical protein